MDTWVVGDVQGCFSTFERLLDRIGWRPGGARLWLAGDLVNRGPDSLAMLRWARGQGDGVQAVLGNHDLHLLAVGEGFAAERPGDTLSAVLAAPDREELLDWLAARPLLVRDGRFVMAHAGLLPAWDVAAAERAARGVEALLRRPASRRSFLAGLAAARAGADSGDASDARSEPGAVDAAQALTRIRIVDEAGAPRYDFDGPPEAIPPGCRPWFERTRIPADMTVLFGHWAALGTYVSSRAVCLDSGCVWGAALTAMRLSDGALVVELTASRDRPEGRPHGAPRLPPA